MIARVVTTSVLAVTLLSGAAQGDEINPVLGKVSDFVLRETDLDRLLASQPQQAQKELQADPDKKLQFVNQLLTMKAVAAKVRKEGYDRKPEVREQLGLVVDNFLARDYIVKVIAPSAKVSEDMLKKAFKEKEKELILPAEVKVRHIFVPVKKDATAEEREKAHAKMETAAARIKKGEDFGKVAEQLSEDSSSAKNGGLLGTITAGGEVEAFEKAAFSLKAGETSGIVESPYGLHIIKVDERKDERQATFDEAKDFLRAQVQGELEQEITKQFIDKTVKEAGLEVNVEKITGTKEKGEISTPTVK